MSRIGEEVTAQLLAALVGAALLVAVAAVGARSAAAGPSSAAEDADRAAILAHIHSIFRAYVERDRESIARTHSADWTGFQGPSTKIERGREAYLANAERSLAAFGGTGYELLDTEVQLLGDFALVYYIARYEYADAQGKVASLGLRSLDVYRREAGGWIQFGSHITPLPSGGAWGEGS
jgi:ketosteroid isomerase-like protein